MRTCFAAGIILAGFWAFAAVPVHADGTSSPGKFAAATSTTGVSYDPPPALNGSTFTVQLAKGKSKRLLLVTGTAATHHWVGGVISAFAYANGVPMEPSGGAGPAVGDPEGSVGHGYLAASWWLDIDAAEQSHPGQFKGSPITIEFQVIPVVSPCGINPGNCPGATMDASLTAQQVKK